MRKGLQAYEAAVSVAQARFDAGQQLKADLLSLKVELAQTRETLSYARHGAALAARAFDFALGLDATQSPVDLAPNDPSLARLTAPDTRDYSLRPELLGLDARQHAAEGMVEAARSGHRPTVNAFASYQYDHGWQLNRSQASSAFNMKTNAARNRAAHTTNPSNALTTSFPSRCTAISRNGSLMPGRKPGALLPLRFPASPRVGLNYYVLRPAAEFSAARASSSTSARPCASQVCRYTTWPWRTSMSECRSRRAASTASKKASTPDGRTPWADGEERGSRGRGHRAKGNAVARPAVRYRARPGVPLIAAGAGPLRKERSDDYDLPPAREIRPEGQCAVLRLMGDLRPPGARPLRRGVPRCRIRRGDQLLRQCRGLFRGRVGGDHGQGDRHPRVAPL